MPATKLFFGLVLISVLPANFVVAQEATGTLSGTVLDSSGKAAANAKISIKNVATGESADTQTDSAGRYSESNLKPGDYEVSASTDAGTAPAQKIAIEAGVGQSLNLTLSQQSGNLPNAPSSSKTEPSLEDLGFSAAESKANPQEQALLDKRTHMLKIHQRMGLITTGPMIATVISSFYAGGKSENRTGRDLHTALGSSTAILYGMTAYYAIRAPKIAGTETRGQIKFHKAMAWIHGPGMVLTPILGAMAFDQKSKGEKVHGIASAHGPVAIVTAGAFGAALLSVSLKF
ncbi:MAG TPA: carboxypeptidase-like regulatory domain-containing protein [Candidatus Sulfotelmatobacter sp.]|nr:carboxypeptidase-like regulatory domain-containing protein [Candidatus Sulfotelmatobacter sp.]